LLSDILTESNAEWGWTAKWLVSLTSMLLLCLAAEYRSRQWLWSTLPPTIRCLWHSPAN